MEEEKQKIEMISKGQGNKIFFRFVGYLQLFMHFVRDSNLL